MAINVFAKFDEIPSLPVQDIKEKPECRGQRAITLTKLAPSSYFSTITTSLPVQVIKDKPTCHGLKNSKGSNSKRMDPSPFSSIINVHLEDINMFVKFYEIPSLPFQDVEKLKRCGRTDGRTT